MKEPTEIQKKTDLDRVEPMGVRARGREHETAVFVAEVDRSAVDFRLQDIRRLFAAQALAEADPGQRAEQPDHSRLISMTARRFLPDRFPRT